jgi:hypothetical protein
MTAQRAFIKEGFGARVRIRRVRQIRLERI